MTPLLYLWMKDYLKYMNTLYDEGQIYISLDKGNYIDIFGWRITLSNTYIWMKDDNSPHLLEEDEPVLNFGEDDVDEKPPVIISLLTFTLTLSLSLPPSRLLLVIQMERNCLPRSAP